MTERVNSKVSEMKVVSSIIGARKGASEADVSPFLQTHLRALRSIGWSANVQIIDDRTSIQGIVRNTIRLRKALNKTNPNVVHAHYGSIVSGITALVCNSKGIIITFGGDDVLGTPNPGILWLIRSRAARQISLWAARRAGAVTVVSRNLFEALPSDIQSRTSIVPWGVDFDLFRPQSKTESRSFLGWDNDRKIVLFNGSSGNNQTVKNLPLAKDTIEVVREWYPNVQLEVIGGVPRETLVRMMNASDCLLVTSLHEGSPNIVKEAMACQLPVVSVDCGDVKERLHDVAPGGVFSYEAHELAAGLRSVFESGTRSTGRVALQEQGLNSIEVARKITELYMFIEK